MALLDDEPALTLLPAAAGAEEALTLARQQSPDIVLLDVSLGDVDGLRACLELNRLSSPPAVVLYTASTDPLLGLKARLVGADAVIGKVTRTGELRRAIAAVLQGDSNPPTFDRDALRAKSKHLSPDALALIGLRLELTPIGDTADALGLDEEQVIARVGALLGILDGDAAGRDDRATGGGRNGLDSQGQSLVGG